VSGPMVGSRNSIDDHTALRRPFCEVAGCNKYARGGAMQRCKAHGGGLRCLHPGCARSAQGATMRCIKHGGGPRCEHPNGCDKAAQGSTRRCVRHGGGKPCLHPGGCNKFARGGTQRCATHGKAVRCTHIGCSKTSHASLAFCLAHSGSGPWTRGGVALEGAHRNRMPQDLRCCQSSPTMANASGDATSWPSTQRSARGCAKRRRPSAEADEQATRDDCSQDSPEEGIQLASQLLTGDPWTSEPTLSLRRALTWQARCRDGTPAPPGRVSCAPFDAPAHRTISSNDGSSDTACASAQDAASSTTHAGADAGAGGNSNGGTYCNVVNGAARQGSPLQPSAAGTEEDQGCFGNCFAGSGTFSGEARARPDSQEPEGGWGFTTCCSQPAHFDCLSRWLGPHKPTTVESSSGEMPIKRKCPFCRQYLPHSSTRMLKAHVER